MDKDSLNKVGFLSLFMTFLIVPTFYKGVAVFITNIICLLFLIVLYKIILNKNYRARNQDNNTEYLALIAIFIIIVIAYYFKLLAVIALILYSIVTIAFIILQYWFSEMWNDYYRPYAERSNIGKISLILTPIVTIFSAYVAFDINVYNDLKNTKILNIFNLIDITSLALNTESLHGMALINFQNGLSSLKGLATTSFERLAFVLLIYQTSINVIEVMERKYYL